MTLPSNNNSELQDQLANFVDRILAGNPANLDQATFAPEEDLRALEQTAIRVKTAFGDNDPDEAVINRIQKNILGQMQISEIHVNESIWRKFIEYFKPSEKKWRSQHSRQRLNIIISLATVVVLMLVAIPFLNPSNGDQPGASGQFLNNYIPIAIGGLILLVLWLTRRKS